MEKTVYFGALTHCYQRTVDHGVVFYKVSDYLLYFTIYCVLARRYKLRVLKLALMADHVHQAVIEEKWGDLSRFVGQVNATFSREYNAAVGRKGPLWETPYGRAYKRGDKAVRTCLVYLDNNPVERKLVLLAENYRWNFMAYAKSNHPFSERIRLRDASMPLRRALKQVQILHSQGRYLPYRLLQRLFSSLPSDKEREQLIDFIISTYSIIRYMEAIRYFGSYEEEVLAAHATTGSEFDIQEGFIGKSDACYGQMTGLLLRKKRLSDIHQIWTLSLAEKRQLFSFLRQNTSVMGAQIAAFLHLPLASVGGNN